MAPIALFAFTNRLSDSNCPLPLAFAFSNSEGSSAIAFLLPSCGRRRWVDPPQFPVNPLATTV